MKRLITGLFLAVIIAGIGGFAATTERASAQEIAIDCTVGEVVDGVGSVSCTLTISDLPDPLGDFTLTLDFTYNDLDGDGAPSAGDQFKCVTFSGSSFPEQTICRPDTPPIPTPPIP